MTKILGWDIGGAHLKAALCENGAIRRIWQERTPIWQGLGHLEDGLETILGAIDAGAVSRHVVTMTGELSDVFASRREGVEKLTRLFADKLSGDILIYGGAAGFLAPGDARSHVDAIASANWHATAALAATAIEDALVIDMGSTTTDILPIAGGQIVTTAASDHTRLIAGELVYQGYTRTPLMAVATHLPFKGRPVPVMNELFATMADVQRLRGGFDEVDDLYPTADGQEKSPEASRRRLARMIGLDAEDGSDAAWAALADGFAEAQLRRIHDAVMQVLSRHSVSPAAPVVIAGTGRPMLKSLAARLDRGVVDFPDLFDCPAALRDAACRAAPAAAVAVLGSRLTGANAA
ncbi:S-layer protein [Jiella sp. MQZ9-1]|uniref:S-layer protein n=1 Tax=Jiella flava TaxID=2816857 RepID=A0A939G1M8_9HYPH|nr:hydantoinase/oxoprolinase family protein [Jiella flava]MBO0663913.1 S-layer protein [Jiella flava]MCD2472485.1 S-layer protein [Jiella flava]